MYFPKLTVKGGPTPRKTEVFIEGEKQGRVTAFRVEGDADGFITATVTFAVEVDVDLLCQQLEIRQEEAANTDA